MIQNATLDKIYIRDPFILPYDGYYYMYGKLRGNDTEFVVYESKTLKEWSLCDVAFRPDEYFWAEYDFWAPEVHIYNDKFYMFASFKSKDRCRGTQILVSDSPKGPFVPITEYPVTPQHWECLDGTLYIDKHGTPFMVFCHEWLQCGDGEICSMELSADLKSPVGEPKVLWKASDFIGCRDLIHGKESKVTDGPFMYRMENGELICIWSTFGSNGYMIVTSRSDNGEIDGNWSVEEEPLFDSQGGHGMIFTGFDGRRYLVLHSPNDGGNERAVLFELEENEGKLIIK